MYALLTTQAVHPITIIYNLRIAETTRRQGIMKDLARPNIIAITPFGQWRNRCDGARQKCLGAIGTYMYGREKWYIRADTAVGNVREKNRLGCFGRTQMDDVLLTAGYGFSASEQAQFTLCGMVGIPTHKDTGFQLIQFGTGHASIGAQFDGAYSFDHQHIMGAVRYIHFFPRNTCIPLVSSQPFRFDLGNLIDLLVAYNHRWGPHKLELGYNPTFAFGASLRPTIPELAGQANFTRSSLFITYQYLFFIRDTPNSIIFGYSFGLDHKPTPLQIKRQMTAWFSWGVNF